MRDELKKLLEDIAIKVRGKYEAEIHGFIRKRSYFHDFANGGDDLAALGARHPQADGRVRGAEACANLGAGDGAGRSRRTTGGTVSKRHGAIRCVADIQEIADLKKRVEELERQINSYKKELTDARDFAKDKSMQLQAARELAQTCENSFAAYHTPTMGRNLAVRLSRIQDAARAFMEMLEADADLETLPEHEHPNIKDQIGKRDA